MENRKFSATRIFDGYKWVGKDFVLITSDKGVVADILPLSEAGDDVETLEGILTPGLINAHCHLELSHLKNVIPPHTGLLEFLCSVVTKRDFPSDFIQQNIEKAEKEMYENGIVAVGDICNTTDAIAVKQNSHIVWHSFIEVLSFTDAKADENMAHYTSVLKQHLAKLPAPNKSVITPHAPYSISSMTFELINKATPGQVISIHNQEHPAEDELYRTGGGEYLRLFKIFGVAQSPFPVTGKSSLQSYLHHFNDGQTIFLIHNTYMSQEDISFANNYAEEKKLKLVYCLCPNANLYIENKLPPLEMLMNNHCHLVLGTDSYSSNWQLSIASEIATLHNHFPGVPLDTILTWATSNAAKALRFDEHLGSFEKGKQPGVTLISNNLETSHKIL